MAADVNASGPFELFGRTHQLLIGAHYDELKSQDQYSGLPGGVIDIFQLAQLPEPPIPLIGDYRTRTEQFGIYTQARINQLDSLNFIIGGRVANYHQYTGNANYGTTPDMPRSPGRRRSQIHALREIDL